jgi:hypothetical protein
MSRPQGLSSKRAGQRANTLRASDLLTVRQQASTRTRTNADRLSSKHPCDLNQFKKFFSNDYKDCKMIKTKYVISLEEVQVETSSRRSKRYCVQFLAGADARRHRRSPA